MKIDVVVSQLLCSRLCHDLVGPSGGINAGIELMAEDGSDGSALDLIGKSAEQMSRCLAFFRIAFGFASGEGATDVDEVRALASGWLDGGKVRLDWPATKKADLPVGGVKVVLNMILMAAESLPRGGDLQIALGALPEGTGIAVTANGEGASIKDEIARALTPDVAIEELSVHNVHAYFAQCLARQLGGLIETEMGAGGEARLSVLIPTSDAEN